MVQDDFDVAEVASLHADIHRHVFRIFIRSLAEDVIVKLDSTCDDEEDFFRGVVLSIESIILEDLHLAEYRQHLPDEFLALVVKESNLPHNLTVRVRHNLTLQVRRQLIDQLLLVELLEVLLVVVAKEPFNV